MCVSCYRAVRYLRGVLPIPPGREAQGPGQGCETPLLRSQTLADAVSERQAESCRPIKFLAESYKTTTSSNKILLQAPMVARDGRIAGARSQEKKMGAGRLMTCEATLCLRLGPTLASRLDAAVYARELEETTVGVQFKSNRSEPAQSDSRRWYWYGGSSYARRRRYKDL